MSANSQPALDITLLSEVPISVCAELETLWTTPRDLLALEIGSVLTLRKATGDNINVYIGSVPFASGEVTVSEGVLGVRIAELRRASEGRGLGRFQE